MTKISVGYKNVPDIMNKYKIYTNRMKFDKICSTFLKNKIHINNNKIFSQNFNIYEWRPPSLSELTPMMFNMGLTHLD